MLSLRTLHTKHTHTHAHTNIKGRIEITEKGPRFTHYVIYMNLLLGIKCNVLEIYIYEKEKRREEYRLSREPTFSYMCFVKRNHSKLSTSNEPNLSHIDQDIPF